MFPEEGKLVALATQKSAQWTARLMGMAKQFLKDDAERHADMPPQINAARTTAIAEAINTRTGDFLTASGDDWDINRAISETEKITDSICAQYQWKPRQRPEDVAAMRNQDRLRKGNAGYAKLAKETK
jgi:hypothetical protein